MLNMQKIGSTAAFLNALVALLTLLVALVLIGPAVMADRALLVDLAIHNPTPLILQDALKFLSAGLAALLIGAFHSRLYSAAPKRVTWATGFGAASILCLLANTFLSLFATTQAASFASEQNELGSRLNAMIGLLGMAAILLNGPWYLLTGWVALQTRRLPKRLSLLGIGMGVLSLLPPLAILVLLLSIIWSVMLGFALKTSPEKKAGVLLIEGEALNQ